jgi:hypothetical protein
MPQVMVTAATTAQLQFRPVHTMDPAFNFQLRIHMHMHIMLCCLQVGTSPSHYRTGAPHRVAGCLHPWTPLQCWQQKAAP